MERNTLEEYKRELEKLSDVEKKERDLYLRAISNNEIYGPMTGYASIDKPWLKYYKKENMNIPVEDMSNYSYFLQMTSEFPKDTVLLNYYGKEYTVEDIKNEVQKYLKKFVSMGLKKGDTISMIMLDVPEVLFMWYAATHLGITSNMIKFDETSERIKYMLDLTKSKYVFASGVPFIVQNLDGALKNNPNVEKAIICDLTESLPLPLQARMLFDEIKLANQVKQSMVENKTISIKENLKNIKNQLNSLNEDKAKINQIISNDKRYEKFSDWLKDTPKNVAIPSIEDVGKEISVIVYTGGTTGSPKGVKLTNNNLNHMANAFYQGDETFRLGKSALNILPPAIAYYFDSTHCNMCSGVKVHLVSHFTVEQYPYLVKKYEPNIFMAGPILLESIRKADIIKDASFMLAPISGGDKLYEEEEKAWNAKYPIVHQGWGMSECCAATTYAKTNCYKLGSIGIPLISMNVGVFEYGTDKELPYNETGELCVSSETVMQGYFDNEEATKQVLKKHADGKIWLHTDDLGVIDSDGNVFHKGRAKRMLTRSGGKVWVTVIEDLVSSNPNVEKCSCVKKEDEVEREVPVLHIVLKDDVNNALEVVEDINSTITSNLGYNYTPKYYVVRNDLPYSEVNKKCDTITLEQENIFDEAEYSIEGNIIFKRKDKVLVRK